MDSDALLSILDSYEEQIVEAVNRHPNPYSLSGFIHSTLPSFMDSLGKAETTHLQQQSTSRSMVSRGGGSSRGGGDEVESLRRRVEDQNRQIANLKRSRGDSRGDSRAPAPRGGGGSRGGGGGGRDRADRGDRGGDRDRGGGGDRGAPGGGVAAGAGLARLAGGNSKSDELCQSRSCSHQRPCNRNHGEIDGVRSRWFQ